jgi:2-keto-4-pentenoate hydratase
MDCHDGIVFDTISGHAEQQWVDAWCCLSDQVCGMALSTEERRRLADMLAEAEATRLVVDPITASIKDADVVDAYEIQLEQIRRKLQAGAKISGHKVGLSSRVMQAMMGVDEPDYGHLLDSMFVYEQDTVDTSVLCQPRVEVEVAFVLGERLEGPGVNVADVLRATEFVMPSIEIIDSRIRNWDIKLVDTIADNASSARVVLGGRATSPRGLDIAGIEAVLTKNGNEVARGLAGAVLGNPVTAVAWLANKVHAFGVVLQPGHVIMPGSCTAAIDAAAGDTFVADFTGIGSVEVNFG